MAAKRREMRVETNDKQVLHVVPHEYARLREITEKYDNSVFGSDLAALEARIDELLGKGIFARLRGVPTAVVVHWEGGEPMPSERITPVESELGGESDYVH